MGCLVREIPRVQAQLAKKGVTCQFDGQGRAIVESAQHRKQLMKAMGLQDIGTRTITMPKVRTMSERSLDNPPAEEMRDRFEEHQRAAYGLKQLAQMR